MLTTIYNILTFYSFASAFPLHPPLASGNAQNTTRATARKYVAAHHMVGNTFPYTPQDWLDDIELAFSKSIDAFALNMGIGEWEPARVNDAYAAASRSGTGFKVFLSLDMSSIPCRTAADAKRVRKLVKSQMHKPSQFKYNGRAFVSTFSGEKCKFGRTNAIDAWTAEFAQHPDLVGRIHFVPSFFVDPERFSDFHAVLNGAFAWNSGWPEIIDTEFAQQQLKKKLRPSVTPALLVGKNVTSRCHTRRVLKTLEDDLKAVLNPVQRAVSRFIGDTNLDAQYLRGLGTLHAKLRRGAPKPTYMGAVAPNFFTHYGQDSWNKSFAYLGDQHLLAKRWEAIFHNRDQYDLIQILSWNDYGESHYIGPIKGALPKSEAWTLGFDHTAFLDVNKFYAEAFKTGKLPDITEDRLVIWSRPHAAKARAPKDKVGPPKNFELFQDIVWALAITSAPGKVTLHTSNTNSKTFDVLRGVTKLAIAIHPGDTMKGSIKRNGKKVVEVTAPGFLFRGKPDSYNYNYFVAGAGTCDKSSSIRSKSLATAKG